MAAILSGLNLSSVSRIKAIWEALPSQSLQSFQQYDKLLSPHDNYGQYRKYVKELTKNGAVAMLPYLPVNLRDITHIIDGCEEKKNTINSEKYLSIGRTVQQILSYKNPGFDDLYSNPFADVMVKSYFTNIESSIISDDDRLFELSLKIHPNPAIEIPSSQRQKPRSSYDVLSKMSNSKRRGSSTSVISTTISNSTTESSGPASPSTSRSKNGAAERNSNNSPRFSDDSTNSTQTPDDFSSNDSLMKTINTPISKWTVQMAAQWASSINVQMFEHICLFKKLNGAALLALNQQTLVSYSLTKENALRILEEIRYYRNLELERTESQPLSDDCTTTLSDTYRDFDASETGSCEGINEFVKEVEVSVMFQNVVAFHTKITSTDDYDTFVRKVRRKLHLKGIKTKYFRMNYVSPVGTVPICDLNTIFEISKDRSPPVPITCSINFAK